MVLRVESGTSVSVHVVFSVVVLFLLYFTLQYCIGFAIH